MTRRIPCCGYPTRKEAVIAMTREGLTPKEIARRCGMTPEDVHSMKSTARSQGLLPPAREATPAERSARARRPKRDAATAAKRRCLRCDRLFDSAWIGNRLCGPCGNTVAGQAPLALGDGGTRAPRRGGAG